MLLVTGGAGFIGSRLVKRLAVKEKICVFDNMVSGEKKNLVDCPNAVFVKGNIKDSKALDALFKKHDFDKVYHLAADPNVRESALKPRQSFDDNVFGTFNILDACRRHDVKKIVFASSSVVYGDAKQVPTPETAPVMPISNYGASKAACEAYFFSYSASYGLKATLLRYANIFGPPSKHGVMFDFFNKLKKNPSELEILGDGLQKKSYLFIEDALDATLLAERRQSKAIDFFNVGSSEAVAVKEIAGLISDAMSLSPKFIFTGGERGWVGDVREMFLDSGKLRALGWKPTTGLKQGIDNYVEWLEDNG